MMRRTLLVVVAVLAAFGAGFLAARRTAPPRPLDAGTGAVVARARGVEIHASDVAPVLGGPAGIAAPARVAEDLARTWYLARLAEEKGLARDPAFARFYAEELARRYVAQEIDEPERRRVPTDDEVKAYFEAHRAEITRPERVRVAVVALLPASGAERARKRAAADAVLAEARRRQADHYAFGELARLRSEDADARSTSGELPPLSREELGARLGVEVADAAFSLTDTGQLLGRVAESDKGFFVVKLLGREPARNPTLKDVQEAMRARLARERREARHKAALEQLAREADVHVDEAALANVAAAPSKESAGR
jgi:peptidyl-prolyl cis-trans isomerase C